MLLLDGDFHKDARYPSPMSSSCSTLVICVLPIILVIDELHL